MCESWRGWTQRSGVDLQAPAFQALPGGERDKSLGRFQKKEHEGPDPLRAWFTAEALRLHQTSQEAEEGVSGPQQMEVLAEPKFWKRKDAGTLEATSSSPHGLLSTLWLLSPQLLPTQTMLPLFRDSQNLRATVCLFAVCDFVWLCDCACVTS